MSKIWGDVAVAAVENINAAIIDLHKKLLERNQGWRLKYYLIDEKYFLAKDIITY